MTDKLKLADPHGDAELSRISFALELEQHHKRLRDMEQNVAALEKLLAEQKRAGAVAQRRAASANNKIGARKDASFKAISTAPSINLTPRGRGMVPVAYPVVQDLSGSVKAAGSVRFNGKPAYLLDQTSQPSCTGDGAGSGGGVRSGTVSGQVKPVAGSRSVRIEGKRVVREGDACTMNGGNNPGIYVTTPATSPAPPRDAIKTSNPPIRPSFDDPAPTDEPENLLGLPQLPLVAQLRATMFKEMADGSAARRQALAIFQAKPTGPLLVADNGELEASRLRTGNSLGIALLGPFGAPGAAARLLGANEQQVAAGNDVGASLMDVALSLGGLPGRQPIPLALKLTPKPTIIQAKQNGGEVKIAKKGSTKTSNEIIDQATSQKFMAMKVAAPGQQMHSTGDGVKILKTRSSQPPFGNPSVRAHNTIRETILAKIKASRIGNASSNFSTFAGREALTNEALAANQSPWPLGYRPTARPMAIGEQFNMVIDANQAQGLRGPGGFGTFSYIPNQPFARNTLAITEQFKSDISFLQRYEVTQPFGALEGPIGPQIDQVTGRLLAGSKSTWQIDLQLPFNQRTQYFKPIGKPVPLPRKQ